MKKIVKKNVKILIGFVLGIIVSGIGVYAAVSIESKNVSYDNSKSGMNATTMQGALDELYEKTDIRKYGNFVSAYTYNQTEGASNYCITGEEETCKKTTCYKEKEENSCKAGDIIKYKVNDTDIITFHVMYDNGETITMQSQKNTINNTAWYASSVDNTKGPLTILPALENATVDWSNVNSRTYTMGTDGFNGLDAHTGCSSYNSCTANVYTLESRTAKARMITVQEATNLGCTTSMSSCPIWMYNYLHAATNTGGTKNGTSGVLGYWTMQVESSHMTDAWVVNWYGSMLNYGITYTDNGARAVVVINK